jgi:hypothetical protein
MCGTPIARKDPRFVGCLDATNPASSYGEPIQLGDDSCNLGRDTNPAPTTQPADGAEKPSGKEAKWRAHF